MVMSSVQICMDSTDWQQQNGMQERGLKSPDDMMSACSRPLLERRTVKQPTDQQALKCPRCDSPNTKFCYYNNYSLSQPRHFCKTCRRYWTRGGALRNVPVGGGCRKNKRTKRGGLDIPGGGGLTSSNSGNLSSAHDLVTNPFQHTPNGSVYYGLPSSGNEISLAFARIQQAARLGDRSAMANCKNSADYNLGLNTQSSMPSSHLSALSALKSSQLSGLEFPITSGRQDHASEDFCSFLETNPHMPGPININPPITATTSNLSMFTASEDHHGQNNIGSGIHWNRLNDQPRIPLPLIHEGHHPDDTQPLVPNFNSEHHHHTISKSKVKTEEPENRLVSEWQIIPGAAASETLFQTAGDNADYWNGGAWPDLMTSYVGSSSIGPIV